MFCLFSVLAQAQYGVKYRITRGCRGCSNTGGSTQRDGASLLVGGEWLGHGAAAGRCSVAESSSGEMRGRSEVLGLDIPVENLGWGANV